ncbi:MAG: hypothetical protein HOC23_18350 [Halieaceae bacterium]|jgi:DNA-binding CsgD family transcriptional regulator|nr:hypothetical protein [Halieaceae bacterium]
MSPFDHKIRGLPSVIDTIGEDGFPAALLEFIRDWADFDSAVIMAYPEASALRVIHNELHAGDQHGFGGAYRDGLWLLSPLYLSAKAGVRGFFHILDIAPANFRDSDYYALYYSSNGVRDHTGFLIESGDGSPVAISLERTSALRAFSSKDKSALAAIAPTVAALVRKQWPTPLDPGESPEVSLHRQVQAVLQKFGSSVLTPRELQVVQLVLKGYPSKESARQLGISNQTEQVHRKNIYQKLGLSSHNQLFSLFFDALAEPSQATGDPLASLLPDSVST